MEDLNVYFMPKSEYETISPGDMEKISRTYYVNLISKIRIWRK